MSYVLGIDLGTTYTSAAVADGGRVEIVQLGVRSSAVPTVVFLTEAGEMLTGDAANRRGVSAPGRVAREFKRRVGDTAPLLLGGTPMAPQALMGTMLRWVLDQVGTERGEPPVHVAVSHPANWGPYKLDLLQQAVRLADLDAATTITEPEAAARYYSSTRRLAPGEIVAVYDLGGGTFDAAVVQATSSGFEILGTPEGIEHLGGIDVDEAVFGFVARALDGALEQLDLDDPVATAAAARLRRDCVEAKEALSSDAETVVPVMLPNAQTEVRITRGELEAMVRPSLVATIGALERALRSAGVSADDLAAVLLVGGASRMPMVAELVGEALGRPVAVDAHPKHAVCLGTALAADADHLGAQGLRQPTAEIVAPVTPPPAQPAESSPPSEPSPSQGRQTVASPTPTPPPVTAPETVTSPTPTPPPAMAVDQPRSADGEGDSVGAEDAGQPNRRRLLYIGIPMVLLVAVAIGLLAMRGGRNDDADIDADGTGSPDGNEATVEQTVDEPADEPVTAAPEPSAAAEATGSDGSTASVPSSTTTTPTRPSAQIAGLSVGRRIDVGEFPDGVAVDAAGRLWVASTFADVVTRIEPDTGATEVLDFPAGSEPLAVAASSDAVFVTFRAAGIVARIDPETFEHLPLEIANQPAYLTLAVGRLWSVASGGWVDQIDPVAWELLETTPADAPAGVAVLGDAAWVTEAGLGTLARIDLATNELQTRFQVGTRPDALASDGEALWIGNRGDGTLARFDPATEQITHRIDIGTAPSGVVVDGDRVWVIDVTEGTLVLVDRITATVVDSIEVGAAPLGLATLDDRVWVSLSGEDALVEVVVAE